MFDDPIYSFKSPLQSNLLFIIAIVVMTILTACSATPDRRQAEKCFNGIATAYEELDLSKSTSFKEGMEWSKAIALLSTAKIQEGFQEYSRCMDSVELARQTIRKSQKLSVNTEERPLTSREPKRGPKNSHQYDDSEIVSQIKQYFKNDAITKGVYIYVDSENGVISLYGKVPTLEIKSQAIALAKGVQGVKKVISKITINSE